MCKYVDGPRLLLFQKSLTRPHLEYGNVVLAPIQQKDIETENVQWQATKSVPGLEKLSYEQRIQWLNYKLSSLVYRRAQSDMVKYFYNIYKVDNSFLPLYKDSITWDHSL